MGGGRVGIQGPTYAGTGCFHRRKIIYGSSPNHAEIEGEYLTSFGCSMGFIKSVAQTLSGVKIDHRNNLSSSLKAAHQVAGCSYEYGTSWGTKVRSITSSLFSTTYKCMKCRT